MHKVLFIFNNLILRRKFKKNVFATEKEKSWFNHCNKGLELKIVFPAIFKDHGANSFRHYRLNQLNYLS